MQNPTLRLLGLALLLGLGLNFSLAQTTCLPDTTVPNVPGLYPEELRVTGCQPFDTTVTFVFPRDTTVNFAGQTLTVDFIEFRIDSLVGLPDSVDWECNLAPGCRYVVSPDSNQVDTFGCVRFFGQAATPGLYNVEVHLTAVVDVLGNLNEQASVFTAPLTVEPCPFVGDCYTLDFASNCEPTTVSFTNNVPSQGRAGFSYQWTLSGPGGVLYQTSDENPFDQLLPEAGDYVLDYQASVDTTGFVLDGLDIDAVGCDDVFDGGDLYWILIDPAGNEVVNTSANPVSNGGDNLPLSTGLSGLLLDTGQYEFQVWDDDLVGGDDGCATGANNGGASLFFSIPSAQMGAQTLVSGSLQITLTLDNPIQAIACRDTFTVDSLPALPTLLRDGERLTTDSTAYCVGGSVLLSTDSRDSLLWYQDGDFIADYSADGLVVDTPGVFRVEAIDRETLCRISSRSVRVDSFVVRAPEIRLDSSTEVFSVFQPSDSVTYVWFDVDSVALGSGPTFDPDSNGLYVAAAVDTLYGCQSAYSEAINYVSGLRQALPLVDFRLYPNPNPGRFTVEAQLDAASDLHLRIYDLRGRLLWQAQRPRQVGPLRWEVKASPLPPGFYLLEVQAGARRSVERLLVE